MKYTLVIAALLGMVSSTQVQEVQTMDKYMQMRRQKLARANQQSESDSQSESSNSESESDEEPVAQAHVQGSGSGRGKFQAGAKFSRNNQAAQHHKDEEEDKDSGSDSDSDSKESGSDSESDGDEEETSAAQRFVQVSRNYWNKQARGQSLMQEPAPGSVSATATKWGKDKPHPGYETWHDDFIGNEGRGEYEREVPTNFQGPDSGDDQFMNSMITKYALESAKPDGTKTGEFVFKYPHAKMAAYEIVDTHLGLKGAAADDYLNKYFDKTWEHFDTAQDGKIEAARMSGFFRFLTGNMQINLH